MPVKEGSVVEGTVTGITGFGAFVKLDNGDTGLVHISEISHDYVKDVSNYVKKNEKVKVKVLSVADGKISLSIKQTKSKKKKSKPRDIDWSNKKDAKQRRMSFEDKMNQFLKDSNKKQEELRNKEY